MSNETKIYLAGPEVFFPADEHQAIVAEKKRMLLEYGLEGERGTQPVDRPYPRLALKWLELRATGATRGDTKPNGKTGAFNDV